MVDVVAVVGKEYGIVGDTGVVVLLFIGGGSGVVAVGAAIAVV